MRVCIEIIYNASELQVFFIKQAIQQIAPNNGRQKRIISIYLTRTEQQLQSNSFFKNTKLNVI
jgi:hypothetical protein